MLILDALSIILIMEYLIIDNDNVIYNVNFPYETYLSLLAYSLSKVKLATFILALIQGCNKVVTRLLQGCCKVVARL